MRLFAHITLWIGAFFSFGAAAMLALGMIFGRYSMEYFEISLLLFACTWVLACAADRTR